MKRKKHSNVKKYIALFCGCVITVTLSSAVVINSRINEEDDNVITKTSYTNYSFSNVYTYDEVPKYIAVVPELTVDIKKKETLEKQEQNKKELEEKARLEEEQKKKEQEELERQKLEEEKRIREEEERKKKEEEAKKIVYDNMTIEQLTEKLNKSLKSTVAGYGNLFASYSLEKGVDPYIATAIMLHETGCNSKCSELVVKCNNVGGIKGSPRCGSGTYKSYETLDDGIRGFIDTLSDGYFSKGMNTPESIVKKYTGHNNTNWTTNVNNYIEKIKAQ